MPSQTPPRSLIWVSLAITSLGAGAMAFLSRQAALPLFTAFAVLSGWVALVCFGHALPAWPFRIRGALLAVATGALAFWLARSTWSPTAIALGATQERLQLACVLLAIFGFLHHFLATYATQVQAERRSGVIEILLPPVRVLSILYGSGVAVLLVRLYAERNWLPEANGLVRIISSALLLEAGLRAVMPLFQPAHLRTKVFRFGESTLLSAAVGQTGPLSALAEHFARTFGVTLGDSWLITLTRRVLAPFVFLALLGLWISSAITSIPVTHQGVLIHNGAFAPKPLAPGIHLHSPWPFGRVALVPVTRLQEVALGFERDLNGPILWAEKHFDGEENLLVGQGEELLTLNVPILYRIADPVAFLRHTQNANTALTALGYRELFGLTRTHDAFSLMTTDREEVASKLRQALQARCNEMNLGLEIVFVGLKDVHPPVPVAPAYQEVVSAEEHQHALVDQARTYSVQSLAAARSQTFVLRTQAEAAGAERRARAEGEASRFLAQLPAFRDHPHVYTARRRLEATEAMLSELRQLYLLPPSLRARSRFFLGADTLPGATTLR